MSKRLSPCDFVQSNGVVYDHYMIGIEMSVYPENLDYVEQNAFAIIYHICEYLD